MKFSIFVIGDKIENYLIDGIKEYKKRLSRYCKIELQFVKSNELLQKKLSEKTFKIIVSIKGKSISSEELAEKINNFGISGISDISLIIGASNIVPDDEISISKMEMDIGIKTTIVFEQIYRAFRILKNEPYHK